MTGGRPARSARAPHRPVTAADRPSSADRARLRDGARATRPGRGVRPQRRRTRGTGVRWIVDPIDGTVNYVYGLPHYAVSIAAEVDGPGRGRRGAQRGHRRGVDRDPRRRRLAGRAAADLLDGDRPGPGAWSPPGSATTRPAGRTRPRVLAGLLPRVRDIRRFGAASLDLCFAAEGRVDAYFEKGLNAWDHAAGGLVAAEAGLLVTGLRGAPPGPAMVVAAPPALHGRSARPAGRSWTPTAGPDADGGLRRLAGAGLAARGLAVARRSTG